MNLEQIYRTTLDRCDPAKLLDGRTFDARNVLAIGKSAAVIDAVQHDAALAAVPKGYPEPHTSEVVRGGHPDMNADTFAAGRRVIEFVDAHDDVLFIISGGGSACVDLPLAPHFEERDLIDTNARLVASGIPIGEINCVRKHLSAIKGGRLAARVRGRSMTLILSDVSDDALADVASGPTVPDPTTKEQAITILERIGGCDAIVDKLGGVPETVKELANATAEVLADNSLLRKTAADVAKENGLAPVLWSGQIESDVDEAAHALLDRARTLNENELLIAGGEPTVVRRGSGKGGRCSELAVRFALAAASDKFHALFGSSDGVDGNSGAAGIFIETPAEIDAETARQELANSNAFAVASAAGRAIMIPPTGNNLRDLYLVARG
jgi:hydroxypyruvate reductase